MEIIVNDNSEMSLIALSVEAILKAGEDCCQNDDLDSGYFIGLFRACVWLMDPVCNFISDAAMEKKP